MNKTINYLFAFVLLLCTVSSRADDVTLSIENYNDWGWESLVIQNGFIELVIVPEIGGRIMRYAMPGDQQMAISKKQIGKKYDPATNGSGPWQGDIGYGGYKNWPSPQSIWNWPPPPVLDWGEYSYTVEHESADSIVIFLESAEEITRMPGLKQARRITAYKNSTVIKIEQYLSNVNAPVRELGIWDITQTITKHEGKNDRGSFSVYFPAKKEKIRNNDNFEINDVDDDIYQFRDTKGSGKMFMNNWAGWCANVDENDMQSYFKIFEVHPDKSYPDDNANFEIYSPGNGAYIEIEVMSPLQKLEKGETMRFDEYWSAAAIGDKSNNVTRAGNISRSAIISESSTYQGVYGIFNSGTIQLNYQDIEEKELGSSNTFNVTAGQKLEINETVPNATQIITLYAYDTAGNLIDKLVSTPQITTGINKYQTTKLEVYPTLIQAGQSITIKSNTDLANNCKITLSNINGSTFSLNQIQNINSNCISANIPNIPPGIYVIQVNSEGFKTHQKLIIK